MTIRGVAKISSLCEMNFLKFGMPLLLLLATPIQIVEGSFQKKGNGMLKKFKKKKRITPVFEKNPTRDKLITELIYNSRHVDRKKATQEKTDEKLLHLMELRKRISELDNELVKCYHCGFAGGVLVKRGGGYCHQSRNLCSQNIKNKNFLETSIKKLREKVQRQKRIDYKIFTWLREKWQTIWRFFRRLSNDNKN